MLVGSFLEELISAYSKLRHRKSHWSYAQLEWQTNSILQLQRLAHEGVGQGTWSNTLSTVPITEKGEELGILDVSNATHPRLIRSKNWSRGSIYEREDKPNAYSSVDQVASNSRSVSPVPSVYSHEAVRSRYSAVSDVSDEELYAERRVSRSHRRDS